MADDEIVEIIFQKPMTEEQTKALIIHAGHYNGVQVLRKDGQTIGVRGPKWAIDEMRQSN
jgi:hypothetical protein